MKRVILVLGLLLIVLVLSDGIQDPAAAQDEGFPTTREEIMEQNPQIAIVGQPDEQVETYPDLDDLARYGSMMTLVTWPTVCVTDGDTEWQQDVYLAVSCGEEHIYTAQFLGACSEDINDPLGTMAAASTEPGRLPVETFACFPIPPD